MGENVEPGFFSSQVRHHADILNPLFDVQPHQEIHRLFEFVCAQLTAKAAREKRSVEELILRGVETGLRLPQLKKAARVTLPLIPSKRLGSVEIDNAKIFEIIPFP